MRTLLTAIALAAVSLTMVQSAPLSRDGTVRSESVRNEPVGKPPHEAAVTGRPVFRVTTNRDGLPQSSVQGLVFDRDGYLWAGTQDGAAVYNGRRWSVVNMPSRTQSNYVTSVAADPGGGVWFGTREGGASKYSAGSWTSFDARSGLPSNGVRAVVASSAEGSTVWFATDSGVARLRGNEWRIFTDADGLPSSAATALLETTGPDGAAALVVGTSRGVARIVDDRVESIGALDQSAPVSVTSIHESKAADGTSTLWVGTQAGLFRRDGDKWHRFTTSDGLPSNLVRCVTTTLMPDGVQSLCVGTTEGLGLFSGGTWRTVDRSSGLPDHNVMTLLTNPANGRTHLLYMGTATGLVRWELDSWTVIDASDGLPSSNVYSVLESSGAFGHRTMLIGTDAGLAMYDGGRWRLVDTHTGLPSARVLALCETGPAAGNRTLWVGTNVGLARFDRNQWTLIDKSSGLPDSGVRCIYEASGENGLPELWVGTYGGAARLSNGVWSSWTTRDGLPSNGVLTILETRDDEGRRTIWAGTYAGVAMFRDGVWTAVDEETGLPKSVIRSLHVSKNSHGRQTLWAGTGSAGVAWRHLDDPQEKWSTLSDSSSPALPNNVVYQICEDRIGRIYLMTNRGVARLTHHTPTPDDPAAFSLTSFTTDDGLPNNECNAGASTVDSDGRIWAGTVLGASVFDPAREIIDYTPSPLRIERSAVASNGEAIADGDELAYDRNAAVFEYALLSFARESDVQYRTQLVGFDDEPSGWSTDFKKEYVNLPAGNYTFTVWGRDHLSTISGPVALSFSVRAAPWRTWWAIALYALAIAGLAFGLLQWRLRSLRRSNERLEQRIRERTAEIAEKVEQLAASEKLALEEKQNAVEANRAKSIFLANMSHELRTPLNAILGFIQLMERSAGRSSDDRESLAIISRSSENLLALILDLLTASKIEAGGVQLSENAFDFHRLLRGLHEMFGLDAQARGLTFVFDPTQENIPRYVWGDENKLRQILVKLLGNAFRFTQRGEVSLRVDWRDSRAFFEVRDTGRGIRAEDLRRVFAPFVQGQSEERFHEGAGLGLTIARTYAQAMDGQMTIESEVGRGTIVRFDVRMPLTSTVESDQESRRVTGLAPGTTAPKILVVDDTWENRALLARILSSVGCEVREARNGEEGVAAWEEWRPDLIWMDTRMPVLDGPAATREIRRKEGAERRVRIIATTTSEFDQERDDVLAAGCDDYLAKPCSEGAILEKIARHLGVRFTYEDTVADDDSFAPEPTVEVARLAAVPNDVLDRLRQAVTEGDVEEASRQTERVREHDDRLANALRSMVRAYRFDEIQELVDRATGTMTGD